MTFYRNSEEKIKVMNKDFSNIKDQFHLYQILCECWCKETCAPRLQDKWSKNNITCGQCSITAFVVQDIFGGEVYGIPTKSGIHCFNKVGNIIFDLTSDQFENQDQLKYTLTNPQDREKHFSDNEKYQRYIALKNVLKSKI